MFDTSYITKHIPDYNVKSLASDKTIYVAKGDVLTRQMAHGKKIADCLPPVGLQFFPGVLHRSMEFLLQVAGKPLLN